MNEFDMGIGFGRMGMLSIIALVVLAIAALVKYRLSAGVQV
jgi:hypothetical protein